MLRAEHQDARSEHRTARTLFEGDLLLSVNDETRQGALRFWNNDGDALAPSETGGPREVTIQSIAMMSSCFESGIARLREANAQ